MVEVGSISNEWTRLFRGASEETRRLNIENGSHSNQRMLSS